jgi:hypothetical protein
VPFQRSSTTGTAPADPAADAVAKTALEILEGASVDIVYSPIDGPRPEPEPEPAEPSVASATGPGPDGWQMTLTIRLSNRIAPLVTHDAPLVEILAALPAAGLRVAAQFRAKARAGDLLPSMRRALRDAMAVETLARQGALPDDAASAELFAEILEYLIELSGMRVESHDLTHGVLVADVFHDNPKLRFDYPADLRNAKRGPLLFDGDRSVLIVDQYGRARTELQRHRVAELIPGADLKGLMVDVRGSGWLVSEATRHLGGMGFFLRADRSIWAYRAGHPLLVRRGEHWTAFPLELEALIGKLIGGGAAASIVVKAALMISAAPQGAIFAIVDDAEDLDGYVQIKDRYDLRNATDPTGMRVETRLHHLIDAKVLDAVTLARLAALDGATVLDAEANLLAYGAIVMSHDSQHEGARTAAAKTLSEVALAVMKVSVDGDITVFTGGEVLARLLTQSRRK